MLSCSGYSPPLPGQSVHPQPPSWSLRVLIQALCLSAPTLQGYAQGFQAFPPSFHLFPTFFLQFCILPRPVPMPFRLRDRNKAIPVERQLTLSWRLGVHMPYSHFSWRLPHSALSQRSTWDGRTKPNGVGLVTNQTTRWRLHLPHREQIRAEPPPTCPLFEKRVGVLNSQCSQGGVGKPSFKLSPCLAYPCTRNPALSPQHHPWIAK